MSDEINDRLAEASRSHAYCTVKTGLPNDVWSCGIETSGADVPNPAAMRHRHVAAALRPTVDALLAEAFHKVWLGIHLRRFDGNEYDGERPDYVSPVRAVDSFYAGTHKAEFIVADIAREYGIDDVRAARPALATEEPA